MVNKIRPHTALAAEYFNTALACFFVILRLYVRVWLQAKFDAADAFVIVALICLCIGNSFDFTSYKLGLWNADIVILAQGPPDLRQYFQIHEYGAVRTMLKLVYAAMASYYSCLFFVKFAFLYLYNQLIPRSMIKLRWALQITTFLTVGGYIAVVCTSLLYCLPVSRNWEIDPSKSCYAALEATPYFVALAVHLSTDVGIYTIPFFLLPRLRFLERSLYGLIAVFSLGFFAIAISVLRIVFNIEVWIPMLCVWSSSEQAAAIVVVCTPPLKWLIKGFTMRSLSKRGSFADSIKNGSGVARSVVLPAAMVDEEKSAGVVLQSKDQPERSSLAPEDTTSSH